MLDLYSICFNEIIGINYCKYITDHDIVFGHVLTFFIFIIIIIIILNNGETDAIGFVGSYTPTNMAEAHIKASKTLLSNNEADCIRG